MRKTSDPNAVARKLVDKQAGDEHQLTEPEAPAESKFSRNVIFDQYSRASLHSATPSLAAIPHRPIAAQPESIENNDKSVPTRLPHRTDRVEALLRLGVRLLPVHARTRYLEEWRGEVAEVNSSRWARAQFLVHLLLLGVPRLAWILRSDPRQLERG